MEKLNIKFINRLLYLLALLIVLLIFKNMNWLATIMSVFSALTPFYIAFFMCWIAQPLVEVYKTKFKINESKANILAILTIILVLFLVLFLILPLLIVQLWELVNSSTHIINNLQNTIATLDNKFHFTQTFIEIPFLEKAKEILHTKSITEILSGINFDYLLNIVGGIAGTLTNTTMLFLKVFIAFIMTFYLIGDFNSFVRKIMGLFFSKSKEKHQEIFFKITTALFGYFKGLFLVCTFISIIVTVGAMLLGVQSPLLFGIIAGLFNVIPYLGPILGGIPLFIVALSNGLTTGLLSLIVIFGAQFIESNFLQPKIMAKNTNLHPVSVMVGLIVFSTLFGFIGMIIATPTLAIISVILKYTDIDIRI